MLIAEIIEARTSSNPFRRGTLTEIALPAKMQDAYEALTAAGYELIGDGSFARLFHKAGARYVLKLFSTHDEPYLAFIKLIRESNNIHFPKIFGKVVQVTPHYYALRMEQLTPIGSDWKDVAMVRKYIRAFEARRKPGQQIAPEVEAFMQARPQLKDACDLINRNLIGRFFCDISPANVMMRGDTLVIIDPVSAHAAQNKSLRDNLPAVLYASTQGDTTASTRPSAHPPN